MVLAAPSGGTWPRVVLTALAAVYLGGLFLNGARSSLPQRLLPPTMLYFVQSACLFPRAARMSIDYRLEGWDCDERAFVELDPRPYFPIHAEDKESRLHRIGYFHRRNRPVLQALERYTLEKEASAGRLLGGIRLSSLRMPFPERGEPVQRWSRRPLHEHPPEQIKPWYFTPVSRREALCAGAAPSYEAPSGARTRRPGVSTVGGGA